MKRIILFVLLSLIISSSSHAFADLINGGFETGDFTGWNLNFQEPSDLAIISNGSDRVHTGAFSVSFSFNSSSPEAVIWQSFSTINGKVYTVSFNFGTIAWTDRTAGLRIEILGSGENTLISQDLIRQGTGTGRVDDWSYEEFTFTADSSSSTIRFTDITPVSHASDAILDDVSVNIASCDCTDSDGDGVIDQWDKCPNTPLESITTSSGCPAVLGDISKNDKLGIEDSINILQTLSNSDTFEEDPITYFDEDLGNLTSDSNSRIEYPNSIAMSNKFINTLGNVNVENFEGFNDKDALPLTVTFDGGANATLDGNTNQIFYIEDSTVSYKGTFPISGNYFLKSNDTFSITFEKELYALGFFVTDYEKTAIIQIRFEDNSGQLKEYQMPHTSPGNNGAVAFWGVIDNSFPFKKVTIIGGNSEDGVAIDDLTINSN